MFTLLKPRGCWEYFSDFRNFIKSAAEMSDKMKMDDRRSWKQPKKMAESGEGDV